MLSLLNEKNNHPGAAQQTDEVIMMGNRLLSTTQTNGFGEICQIKSSVSRNDEIRNRYLVDESRNGA
jgi:hypothetical protein